MSKEIKTTKTNNKKSDNPYKLGFWAIIIIAFTFFTGVYLGGLSITLENQKIEEAKTSAIEDYKATLKAEQ